MIYSSLYYKQLSTALRFLSDRTNGAYCFAMAEHQGIVAYFMDALLKQTQESGLNIHEIWLKKTTEADFMMQIQQTLPCDGLVVRNFSEYFYLSDDRTRIDAQAMRGINYAREGILELNIPIIFWIDKDSFGNLANFATDFYTQRMGGTLHLTDRPESRVEPIRIPEFDYIDETKVALDIELYESQLAEYPETLRIQELVLPLTQAYLKLGKVSKALKTIALYIPNPDFLTSEQQLSLADLYFQAGEKHKAESLLESLESRTDLPDKLYSQMCFLMAKVIDSNYNRFDEAFPYLQKALLQYEKQPSISEKQIHELGILYDDLINRLWEYGKLDEALAYAQKMQALFQNAYEENKNNVYYKNGLAVSYSKLGDTHRDLGDLEKALAFYEERNRLGKELYEANKNNVAFKNGLAISYSKLGETHTALGDLEKALAFYEEQNRLGKELYEANKNNVELKNGLAVSYWKLGEIFKQLRKHIEMLSAYEESHKLCKELFDLSPQNISFKSNLAESLLSLGESYRDIDKKKGKIYLLQAEALWKELVRDAPQYAQFKRYLGIVQEVLGRE